MRTADAAARVPSMDGTNNSALEVQILEEKVSYLASWQLFISFEIRAQALVCLV